MVSRNTFTGPLSWPRGPQPPISIEYCRNVTISDNKFESTDSYAKPLLHVGDDVQQLTQDVTTSNP